MRKNLISLALSLLVSLLAHASCAEVKVVVASDSPIMSLSSTQLADIYLGRMTRLPNGVPVEPIDQSERSSAHDEFYRQYLGRMPAQIKAHWARLIFTGRGQPPRSVADSEAMAKTLADNPKAIGYLEPSQLGEGLRVVTIE